MGVFITIGTCLVVGLGSAAFLKLLEILANY